MAVFILLSKEKEAEIAKQYRYRKKDTKDSRHKLETLCVRSKGVFRLKNTWCL